MTNRPDGVYPSGLPYASGNQSSASERLLDLGNLTSIESQLHLVLFVLLHATYSLKWTKRAGLPSFPNHELIV
jgi:hypothetical protein